MAVDVRTPETARRSPHTRPRGGTSFELWSWFFMRISGLVLLLLVLGHFTIVHLLGDGIDRVDFAFVAGRWASPFWQTWDWCMLFLGMLHGANGLKTIINEYVRTPGRRTAAKSVLYVLTFVFIILGSAVILTFDPAKGVSTVLEGIAS